MDAFWKIIKHECDKDEERRQQELEVKAQKLFPNVKNKDELRALMSILDYLNESKQVNEEDSNNEDKMYEDDDFDDDNTSWKQQEALAAYINSPYVDKIQTINRLLGDLISRRKRDNWIYEFSPSSDSYIISCATNQDARDIQIILMNKAKPENNSVTLCKFIPNVPLVIVDLQRWRE